MLATETKIEITKLNIEEIEQSMDTQSRAAISSEVVEEYAEMIKEGTVFDPVTVFYDGKKYWLADGWHRMHAHTSACKTTIACTITEGTKRDAIWHSLGANARHGKAIKNVDKRRAVNTALDDPEWACLSVRKIAAQCGCGHVFVHNMRKERESVHREQNSLTDKVAQQVARTTKPASKPPRLTEAANYDDSYHDGYGGTDYDDARGGETFVAEAEDESEDNVLKELAKPYREMQQLLSSIKSKIETLAEDPDNGGHICRKSVHLARLLKDIRKDVRSLEPVDWCNRCGREGCPACNRTSFITRFQRDTMAKGE